MTQGRGVDTDVDMSSGETSPARRANSCSDAYNPNDPGTKHIFDPEQAGTAAETALVLASDHGFANVTRCLNPNALLLKAGLLKLDAQGRLSDWDTTAQPNGGSAYLYTRRTADTQLAAHVLRRPATSGARPETASWHRGEMGPANRVCQIPQAWATHADAVPISSETWAASAAARTPGCPA